MLESAAVRALLLSLAAGLSTLLGALVVFAARRRSEKLLAVSLGFAGGVMLAVSFTDLFPTAREHLTASLGGRPGALAAVLSLAAGIGCAAALDHLVPHDAFDADTGEAPPQKPVPGGLCVGAGHGPAQLPRGRGHLSGGV